MKRQNEHIWHIFPPRRLLCLTTNLHFANPIGCCRRAWIWTKLYKSCQNSTNLGFGTINETLFSSFSIKNRANVSYPEFVGNKAKGLISKRMFQENKARQIFRKMNISYPLIRTRTSRNGTFNHKNIRPWRS